MLQVVSSSESEKTEGSFGSPDFIDVSFPGCRLYPISSAHRLISPRLSVERDFNLMTPWMELVGTTNPTACEGTQPTLVATHVKLEKVPPETPRRLTRSLARKLQHFNVDLVDRKETQKPNDPKQLGIQKSEGEETGSRGIVSTSPPAIEVHTQSSVETERDSSVPPVNGLPQPNLSKSLFREPAPQLSDSKCSGCGVLALSLPYSDHLGKAMCEQCHDTITEAEKELEGQVSLSLFLFSLLPKLSFL